MAGRQTLNSHAYDSVNVEQLMVSNADDEQTIWQRVGVDDLCLIKADKFSEQANINDVLGLALQAYLLVFKQNAWC